MPQTGNPSPSSGSGDQWLLLNPAHPATSSQCPKEVFPYPLCHHLLLKEKPTEELILTSAAVRCWGALPSRSPTGASLGSAQYLGVCGTCGWPGEKLGPGNKADDGPPRGSTLQPGSCPKMGAWWRTGEGGRVFVA